jgi:hypothetical protein
MVFHVVDFLSGMIGKEEENNDLDLEDEEMTRQAAEFLQQIIEKESSLEGFLFAEEFAVMAQFGAVSL